MSELANLAESEGATFDADRWKMFGLLPSPLAGLSQLAPPADLLGSGAEMAELLQDSIDFLAGEEEELSPSEPDVLSQLTEELDSEPSEPFDPSSFLSDISFTTIDINA